MMMNMEETILVLLNISMLSTLYMVSTTHIMNNLIILEFIVISIITMLFNFIKTMKMENYLIMYFIILMIMESVVGVTLLIMLIRTHSNDFIKSIMVMKL